MEKIETGRREGFKKKKQPKKKKKEAMCSVGAGVTLAAVCEISRPFGSCADETATQGRCL